MRSPEPVDKSGPDDSESLAAPQTVIRTTTWIGELLLRGPAASFTRLVALILASYMSPRGEGCFPSYRRLAQDAGSDKRTMVKHVRALIEAGWLQKVRPQRIAGRRRSNHYIAAVPLIHSSSYPQMGDSGSPSGVIEDHPMGDSGSPIEPHTNKGLNLPVKDTAPAARRARKTTLPEDWAPSEALWRWARERNIAESYVKTCLEAFTTHARAHARLLSDWEAGLRMWILGERKFAGKEPPRASDERAPVDTRCCWTNGGAEPRCEEDGSVNVGGGSFLCATHAGELSRRQERAARHATRE
jgi:Helix-turn-helix domain